MKNFLSINNGIKSQKALKQNMATHTQKELKEFIPTHKQLTQNMRKIVDEYGDEIVFQDGDELKGELTELDYGIITDLGLPSRTIISDEETQGELQYIYEKDGEGVTHRCLVEFWVDCYKKKENGDILHYSPSGICCENHLEREIPNFISYFRNIRYNEKKYDYDIIELKAYIYENYNYSKHFKSKPFLKYERSKRSISCSLSNKKTAEVLLELLKLKNVDITFA